MDSSIMETKSEPRPPIKRCWHFALEQPLRSKSSPTGGGHQGMSMWKHKLVAELFPRHIGLLDWVNRNALVRQWIAEQRGRIPTFKLLYDFYRYVHNDVCGGSAIDFLE